MRLKALIFKSIELEDKQSEETVGSLKNLHAFFQAMVKI